MSFPGGRAGTAAKCDRMRWGVASGLLVVLLSVLTWPGVASGAVPPNRDDPCAAAGHDTCGTTGTGFYRRGRYGVRWYGDYTNAVPREPHTFCIDLRFWYASPSYRYAQRSTAGLRNKDGARVPAERLQRISYAIWNFGQTGNRVGQAAVMLYVHRQMGDARPSELDAATLGARVAVAYTKVAQSARRFHGPYRIQTRFSGALTVGRPVTATVRLLSASGHAVPHAHFTLTGSVESKLVADSDGRAAFSIIPAALDLRLRVVSGPVAASAPKLFVPTSAAGAANGQRLAAPASDSVTATVAASARPVLQARASTAIVRPGRPVFDQVRVPGLNRAIRGNVELYGPFGRRASISCTGRPYWQGRMSFGNAEARSPAVRVRRPGFYVFAERVTSASPTTTCESAGTVLVAPGIAAGRGERRAVVGAVNANGVTPTSIRIPSLGIRVRVKPVGIDLRHGTLGIPAAIAVAGWWRDGTAPGGTSGAILISGHVDSARDGAGAFFALPKAKVGAHVQLSTAAHRIYSYRIVSVRSYPKRALPLDVYSSRGPGRLVLVTCGGPFDQATGHYADNVVVTATPVRSS